MTLYGDEETPRLPLRLATVTSSKTMLVLANEDATSVNASCENSSNLLV
jgi:hypothetical protein